MKKKRNVPAIAGVVLLVLILLAAGVFVALKVWQPEPEAQPTEPEVVQEVVQTEYDYTAAPISAWSKTAGSEDFAEAERMRLIDYSDIAENKSGIAVFSASGASDLQGALYGVDARSGERKWEQPVDTTDDCVSADSGLKVVCVRAVSGGTEAAADGTLILVFDAITGEKLIDNASLCALLDCVEPINAESIQVVTAGDKIALLGSIGAKPSALFAYAYNTKDLSEAYKVVTAVEGVDKGGTGSVSFSHNSRYIVESVFLTYYVIDASDGELVQTAQSEENFVECHPGPFDDAYTCTDLVPNLDDFTVTSGTQTVYRNNAPIYSETPAGLQCSRTSTPLQGLELPEAQLAAVACGNVIDKDGNTTFKPADVSLIGGDQKHPYPVPYTTTQYQTYGNLALELFGAQSPAAPLTAYALGNDGEPTRILWDLTEQYNPITMDKEWYENESAYAAKDVLIAGLTLPSADANDPDTTNTPTAFSISSGEKLWELPSVVMSKPPRLTSSSTIGYMPKRTYTITNGALVGQTAKAGIAAFTFAGE